MNGLMSLTLVEGVLALEQTETQYKENVSRSQRRASYNRSCSDWFSVCTKDPSHPDKRAELLVAKEFQDRADMEEAIVESRLQSLAKIRDLKRRMLLLLEGVGKLEVSIAAHKH